MRRSPLASVALSSPALLWVWIVPILLGQPFLRAYLLAEHARCPHVANMLENTRTTFTTALVRLIAWNMPFHAEHHAYPAVPFHKLPRFHAVVARASAGRPSAATSASTANSPAASAEEPGTADFVPPGKSDCPQRDLAFARRAKPIMKRQPACRRFRSQQ